MTKTKDFNEGMKGFVGLEELAQLATSNELDSDQQASARDSFTKKVREVIPGYNVTNDDFNDPQRFRQLVSDVAMPDVDDITNFFATERSALYTEIGNKKLAENVYSITPVKISGNAGHNKGVKAHEEVRKYDALAKKAQNGENGAVREVMDLVAEDVKKNLEKAKVGKRKKHIEADTIKHLQNVAKGLAARSPAYAASVAFGRRDKAIDKFEKIYSTDAQKASYFRETQSEMLSKGKQETLQAARDFYNISSRYKEGKKLRIARDDADLREAA